MSEKQYPKAWASHDQDFMPGGAMMDLKGRDYLNVQNRLRWFVRDQRALIVAGVATMPYVIKADLVEHDPERGYAQYSCYVRDVLGNECTQFGSETAKDFGDYREKASTKALGRALLGLGYSTGAAADLDEGDKPVDAPQERRQAASNGHANGATANGHGHGHAAASNGDPINAADLKARAEALGHVGPKWGALWNRHKGNLAAIDAELAQESRPRP